MKKVKEALFGSPHSHSHHEQPQPSKSAALPPSENVSLPTKKILIIDSDAHNWHETFANCKTHDGFPIEIQCCEWDQMAVSAEFQHKPLVNIKPNRKPRPHTNENEHRTFQPDFVIVRKLVQGLTEQQDYTNVLYGVERSIDEHFRVHSYPIVYAALRSIQRRIGDDQFPLIPMTYYSHGHLLELTDSPRGVVMKIGSAEAGYGKLKFDKPNDALGAVGIVDEHHDYFTIEHFVQGREYDIRVQRIGSHLRAYKRVNANWKGNVGQCKLDEIPVSEQFRRWADEASKLFGGLDILTVDAIHTADGTDHILEINDTASGFAPTNQKADMEHVKELALQRMTELKI